MLTRSGRRGLPIAALVIAAAILVHDIVVDHPPRLELAGFFAVIAILGFLFGGKRSCGNSSDSPPS